MGQFFIKRGDKVQGPASLQQLENLRAKLKATDLIGEAPNGPWTTWEQAESNLFPTLESLPLADLDIPVATPPTTWQQPTQPQDPQATASKPVKNNKALFLGLGIGGAVIGLVATVLGVIFLFAGGKPREDAIAQTPKQTIPLTRKHFQEKVDSLGSKRKGTYKDASIESYGRSTVEISRAAMLAIANTSYEKNPAGIYYTLFDSTYNEAPTPSILDFIVWDSGHGYEFDEKTKAFKKKDPNGFLANLSFRYRIRIQLTTEAGRWVVTKIEGKREDDYNKLKKKELALDLLRNEELSQKIEAYFNNEADDDDEPFYEPYWDFPK